MTQHDFDVSNDCPVIKQGEAGHSGMTGFSKKVFDRGCHDFFRKRGLPTGENGFCETMREEARLGRARKLKKCKK